MTRERFVKIGQDDVAVEQIHGCEVCGIHIVDTEYYNRDLIRREREDLNARLTRLNEIEITIDSVIKEK